MERHFKPSTKRPHVMVGSAVVAACPHQQQQEEELRDSDEGHHCTARVNENNIDVPRVFCEKRFATTATGGKAIVLPGGLLTDAFFHCLEYLPCEIVFPLGRISRALHRAVALFYGSPVRRLLVTRCGYYSLAAATPSTAPLAHGFSPIPCVRAVLPPPVLASVGPSSNHSHPFGWNRLPPPAAPSPANEAGVLLNAGIASEGATTVGIPPHAAVICYDRRIYVFGEGSVQQPNGGSSGASVHQRMPLLRSTNGTGALAPPQPPETPAKRIASLFASVPARPQSQEAFGWQQRPFSDAPSLLGITRAAGGGCFRFSPSLSTATTAVEPLPALPADAPCRGATAVACRGRIFLLGGKTCSGAPCASVYAYDPERRVYELETSLPRTNVSSPAPSTRVHAFAHARSLFLIIAAPSPAVLGGDLDASPPPPLLRFSLWRYDLDLRAGWAPLAATNPPAFRDGAACAAVGGVACLVGGKEQPTPKAATKTVVASRPGTPNPDPSSPATQRGIPSRSVDVLDLASVTWCQGPALPAPRVNASAAVTTKGDLVVAGGFFFGAVKTAHVLRLSALKPCVSSPSESWGEKEHDLSGAEWVSSPINLPSSSDCCHLLYVG